MSEEFKWLVRLRWYAAAGQFILICTAAELLQGIPLRPLLLIVCFLVLSNLALKVFKVQPTGHIIGSVLLLDTLLLTGLLYWSGGVANPFSLCYVIHVALAAFLLGQRWTWTVALLSTMLYGLLFFFYVELPQLSMHSHHNGFSLHLQGMWLAFALVAAVLAFFLTRLLHSIQLRDEKLKAAELLRLQQERIASVTALAASAAHELNSPLATIGLAAEEIGNVLSQNLPLQSVAEDAELIRTEVRRCALILERLRTSAADPGAVCPEEIGSEELLMAIQERIDRTDADRIQLSSLSSGMSIYAPRRPLIEALVGLVRNALAASVDKPVVIECQRQPERQEVRVIDLGLGMTEAVLHRMGEPFFTTKAQGTGLGLGVFLARRFAEAMNGDLIFRSSAGQGTTVSLELPLIP